MRTANKLVLYTNINKITSFYRLISGLKNRKQVPPHIKKMLTILHAYTKLSLDRTKKDVFTTLKQ
jgi:hypothetical protein